MTASLAVAALTGLGALLVVSAMRQPQSQSDDRMASDLWVGGSCGEEPRRPAASLSWTPVGGAAEQRVEVTTSSGFDDAQAVESQLLPAGETALPWQSLGPGAVHNWRVLSLLDDEWVVSEIASFRAPFCASELPSDDPRIAATLQAAVACSDADPRLPLARLTWIPALSPGTEQRVVVASSSDGFDAGAFDSSDWLTPDQSSLVWEALRPGVAYSWRVLTLQDDGWVAGEVASFDSMSCEELQPVPTQVPPPTPTALPLRTSTPFPATSTPRPTVQPVPTQPPAPATPTPAGPPIRNGPGGSLVAANLVATSTCVGGRGSATLRWTVAPSVGSEQQVAITMFADGFERGDYQTSPVLPPNQSSLVWAPLGPGIAYRWRVLTLHGESWASSEIDQFTAPNCPPAF